jgi:hypothetical protein
MAIDAILQTRHALRVGARQLVQHDRASRGQDQPRPDDPKPALAALHLGVIVTDQARPAGISSTPPPRLSKDVLSDLGDGDARRVRAQPRDQGGGDHRAGLEDIGRDRRLQPLDAGGARIARLPAVGRPGTVQRS